MPLFFPGELADWSGGGWDPSGPGVVRGVGHDTRTLRPGDLYVALKGERVDGHDFVDAAFERGACAAMVAGPKAPASRPDRPLLRVDDTRVALRRLAAGYRQLVKPTVIGVTGSAGKSTVKEMVLQILSRAVRAAGTRGNWNNEIGLSLSLLSMERDAQVGVFEVGTNHPGEIADLCGVLNPDWGLITNVGEAHAEFFGSVEAIAEEKGALLRALPASGLAVLNGDDRWFERLRALSPARVVTVSLDREADYTCRRTGSSGRDVAVSERSSREAASLTLPLPGRHNVYNALMAAAAARQFGVGWEAIRAALAAYAPLPMRWHETRCRGVRIINDAYNANPHSMRASIQTFAEEPVRGRKWLVLGGMLELGAGEVAAHREVGRFVAAGDWAGLLTVGGRGEWIAEGAESAGLAAARIIRCADNARAAETLAAAAAEGDAALLKASRGMHLEEVAERFGALGKG